MTINQYRHPAEADARTKEKGTTPFESAPQANQTADDSTTDRPLYLPLRREAIDRKRGEA